MSLRLLKQIGNTPHGLANRAAMPEISIRIGIKAIRPGSVIINQNNPTIICNTP